MKYQNFNFRFYISFLTAALFLTSSCKIITDEEFSRNIFLTSSHDNYYSAAVWGTDPVFDYKTNLLNRVDVSESVQLSAYTDSSCTTLATGVLGVLQNPVTSTAGTATFQNMSYTLPNSLEETLYLKVVGASTGISLCDGGIPILHHFNLGDGYTVFPDGGGNGAAGAAAGAKDDEPYSFQIDSQGRYVITGISANAAGGYELAIWRYNPDGTVDTTFGDGATAGLGYVLFQAGGLGAAGRANATKYDYPFNLKIDSQGRYVIVGTSKNAAGGTEATLWRYNSSGAIDTTFGDGATAGLGYVLFQAGGTGAAGRPNATKYDWVDSLQIDSQGRYILSGYSRNAAGGYELTIWRYNSSGAIDTTFGDGATAGLGYILFQAGGLGTAGAPNGTKWDGPNDLQLDSQGRYLLTGYSLNASSGYEVAIWRFNTTGAIDTTFGDGATAGLGYVLFQAGGTGAAGALNGVKYDESYYLRIDSNGRYVISGISANAAGGYELAIWRYNSTGAIDTTFGDGATAGLGYVLFQAGGAGTAGALNAVKYDWTGSGFEIDSDGKYVINGNSQNSAGTYEHTIWRYNSTGAIDTTFGDGATAGLGYVLFQAGANGAGGAVNAAKDDVPNGFLIDTFGRYVSIAYSANTDGAYELAIFRYLSTGSIDD